MNASAFQAIYVSTKGIGGRRTSGPTVFDNLTVTVDTQGEVHDVESQGKKSLPFLQGSLPQMILVPLSPGEMAWETERALTIVRSQEQQNNDPLARFRRPPLLPRPGMRPPFGRRPGLPGRTPPTETKVTILPACERVKYIRGKSTDETAVIKKQYELVSLDSKTTPKLKLTGDGEIVFDIRAGVPEKMDFKAVYEQREGTLVKVPLKISYELKQIASTGSAVPVPGKKPGRNSTEAKLNDVLAVLRKSQDASELQSALAKLGGLRVIEKRRDEVAELLEKLLGHSDRQVVQGAAFAMAIGKWCTALNVPSLITLVEGEDSVTRGYAIKALGHTGDPRAVGPLLQRLGGSDSSDRFAAEQALKALGREAEAGLVQTLSHDRPVLRAKACAMLQNVAGPDGIAGLKKAAEKEDHLVVRRAINAALKKLTNSSPLDDKLKQAAKNLKPGNSELNKQLASLCGDQDFRRSGALRTIARLTPEDDRRAEVLEAAKLMLEDPRNARSAMEVIGKWGTKQQAPLLISFLEYYEDSSLRFAATRALTQMGEEGEDAVIKCLTHKDARVRREACSILRMVGGDKALKALQELADSTSDRILKATAEAAVRYIKRRRDR